MSQVVLVYQLDQHLQDCQRRQLVLEDLLNLHFQLVPYLQEFPQDLAGLEGLVGLGHP